MQSKPQVQVYLGTRKGGFILSSDADRKKWDVRGPVFKGWNVMHMNLDPRDRRLHAGITHDVYGPSTHYSDDFGEEWTQAAQVPAFPRPSAAGRPLGSPDEAREAEAALAQPETVSRVWHIRPGRPEESGVLYAGVAPAALFKSTDRGETWTIMDSLFDHPHRPQWFPGGGGLCLHTVVLDPENPNRMYVAVSAGGFYRSDDNGQTWAPYNRNVRADFHPDPEPEFGHCVHKVAFHPSRPGVLFQQNHCGVYRSDDYGENWTDIGDGKLPSRFGFPIAVHPHEPETVYLALEESDEYRLSVNGKFAVWRSKDSGESWQRMDKGFPERAHLVVYREAMAVDNLDSAGVYVGSSTGQVFHSRDGGDTWDLLIDYLPPILSVEAAVI